MTLRVTGNPDIDRQLIGALQSPAKFARLHLGDELWSVQEHMLSALTRPHARVAVKACHASSKTFGAAEATLWFVTAFPDSIVITTAPTDRQVEKELWAEVHLGLARAKSRGYRYPAANLTELRLAKGNYAIGFSTDKRDHAVRFQGFHAPHMLVVLDEAPGIPAEVWQAIDGIRAGGDVRILALGNPIVSGGPFYEAFSANRETWRTFTIDAFDTPNFVPLKRLAGGDPGKPANAQREVEAKMIALLESLPASHLAIAHVAKPYLVTPRWAQEMLRQWGIKSPWWQSRVRGQFPEQSEDALLSLAWLLAAKERQPRPECEHRELDAGVDVAGPGSDETAVYVRCNDCSAVLDFAAWSTADPRGECVAFLNSYEDRLEGVNVDSIGIGYNFGLHLDDQGFPVNLVNVGESAKNGERFANQKAAAYWGLRERFEAGEVSGLNDETTISQLASIRYQPTPRGQVRIESKEELRRRGVKSPDRAEALMLAYCARTPGIVEYYRKNAEAQARGKSPEWQDEDSLIEEYELTLAEYEHKF